MVRLLTFNIHGGIGQAGRNNHAELLEVIARSEADVVGLQEVYEDQDLFSALHGLGYQRIVHGRTIETVRGSYGNILMSRVEPSEVQHIDLDVGGAERRGAVRFHLELPDGPLDVCTAHLGLGARERLRQVRKLDAALANADGRHGDVFQALMGDLNEWRPATRMMRSLRRRFSVVSTRPTFPSRRPLLALDRIAVRHRGCSVVFRRLDEPPADRLSDHRPLIAEIEAI